jgi:hypothetical protein
MVGFPAADESRLGSSAIKFDPIKFYSLSARLHGEPIGVITL